MDELVKYSNYEKLKYNTKINYFLYIMITIIIILCVMIHKVSFKYYYYNKSVVTKYEDKYYLKMYVLKDDLSKINKHKYLIYNNTKYKYKLYEISDLLVDNNYNEYYEIYIDTDIDYKLNNNVVEIKVEWDNKLLNKVIYEFFRG